MNRKVFIFVFIGIFLLMSEITSSAEAQESQNQQGGRGRDWSLQIGPWGLFVPKYEGSDDYGFLGYPLIYATWRDRFFVDPRTGAGAYLWNGQGAKLGLFTAYSPAREEDSSIDLAGLGDIEDGAIGGVVFEYWIKNYFFHTRYEQRYAGEDTGPQMYFGMGRNLGIGKRIYLQSFLKTTYSSSDYMQTYFSISPSQSDLFAFKAESGFKSIGLEFNAFYGFNRHWMTQVMVHYNRLLGDAADSPIVQDKNQHLLGVALLYAF